MFQLKRYTYMQQPAYKKLSCSLKKRNENNNITERNTNRVVYSNTYAYAHHCNTLYSNIALTTNKRESADQNTANINGEQK